MNSKTSKTEFPTVAQLQEFNNSLYHTFFSLPNFQRKYRKFFKFSILSLTSFSMHFKGSKHGLRVTVNEENYYSVKSTKTPHLHELNCLSQRELIEKIIKHDLI